jgi:hypothetical protein
MNGRAISRAEKIPLNPLKGVASIKDLLILRIT